MENPASWPEAERVIQAAYNRWNDGEHFTCGTSLHKTIADALRAAGLLREEPLVNVHEAIFRKVAADNGWPVDENGLAEYVQAMNEKDSNGG